MAYTTSVICDPFYLGGSLNIRIAAHHNSRFRLWLKLGDSRLAIATTAAAPGITMNLSTGVVAEIYKTFPNARYTIGTVEWEEYFYTGEGEVTQGSSQVYIYAQEADCIPDVTATIVDTNQKTIEVTGNKNKLVCYISQPKVTVNATAKNGASIRDIQAYNPVGLLATESPHTFETVYSNQFIIKATDTRSYSKEITKTVEFVEYDPAFFGNYSLAREESTSNTAILQTSGYCARVDFGAVNNTLTVKYRYKEVGGNYGEYITASRTWNADGTFSTRDSIEGLDLDKQYFFEIVVEDKLTQFKIDQIVLSQGTGDMRIAQDYIQFKNSVRVGDINNTAWKAFSSRRKLFGAVYESNFGTGLGGSVCAAVMELYENDKMIGRTELRNDGFLYNALTSMSFAEIMAMAQSNNYDGSQGYMILNGGSSNPILVMWGMAHVTPSGANVPTSKKVYFNNQFKGMPFVKVSPLSSVPGQMLCTANNLSESGFDIVIDRTNTVTTSVGWFAIGNGSNALPE